MGLSITENGLDHARLSIALYTLTALALISNHRSALDFNPMPRVQSRSVATPKSPTRTPRGQSFFFNKRLVLDGHRFGIDRFLARYAFQSRQNSADWERSSC